MPKVKTNGTRHVFDPEKILGAYLNGPNGQWCHVSGTHSMLIVQRRSEELGKPNRYMLFVDSDGHRRYFSSIYPTQSSEFRVEHGGTRYNVLPISSDRFEIRVETQTKSHVYHKDFVSLFETAHKGGLT